MYILCEFWHVSFLTTPIQIDDNSVLSQFSTSTLRTLVQTQIRISVYLVFWAYIPKKKLHLPMEDVPCPYIKIYNCLKIIKWRMFPIEQKGRNYTSYWIIFITQFLMTFLKPRLEWFVGSILSTLINNPFMKFGLPTQKVIYSKKYITYMILKRQQNCLACIVQP